MHDNYQADTKAIYDNFSLFAKIDRHFAADIGLHLANAPVRRTRMAHQLSGFKKSVEIIHQQVFPKVASMSTTPPDFAALVSSRICHDLISPIGAIDNGMELLAMAGMKAGPEVDLISQSVGNANARIRFFRVAFGLASDTQMMPHREISSILTDLSASGRVFYEWHGGDSVLRRHLRPAFLAVMCLETALPVGGKIRISRDNDRWVMQAQAERVALDSQMAEALRIAPLMAPDQVTSIQITPDQFTPAQVQFALLPQAVHRLGRRLESEFNQTTARIQF